MPVLGPIKRRDLIFYLKRLGFDGPYAGARHEFLAKGGLRLRLPNPHQGDISTGLITRILREAGISREEWERL